MKPKVIDSHFTAFWGVFLNLSCNLNCSYCIQKISHPMKPITNYKMRSGSEWVAALNAISNRAKKRFLRRPKVKKLSILGGEPTIYPDFLFVLNNLDKHWKITVTSNFDTPFFDQDIAYFKKIKNRKRIRFNGSLHYNSTPVQRFIANVKKLKKAGINVHTLFLVYHPAYKEKALKYKEALLKVHPRVKLQRFLGMYNAELFPRAEDGYAGHEQIDGITNYNLYHEGFAQKKTSPTFCHSDKVLIAPNGDVYDCHYKVYTNHKEKLGNLFNEEVEVHIPRDYFFCEDFGFCNPCDSEGHLFRTLSGVVESISGENK